METYGTLVSVPGAQLPDYRGHVLHAKCALLQKPV